ncbi:MAG TPA: hypothetical protein VMU01_00080 [Rhizomicrobium sp.]|nr:hypothetical protein [Rhizomicrobium sp.]
MKIRFVAMAVAGIALGGCTESVVNMSPDYGVALRQDVKAQIADPDAQYAGVPDPGSNGARVGLAQKRYEKGQVIEPAAISASGSTQQITSGGNNGAAAGASP